MKTQRRSIGLIIVGWFIFLFGVFGFVPTLVLPIAPMSPIELIKWHFLGVVYMISGIGVLLLNNTARVVAICAIVATLLRSTYVSIGELATGDFSLIFSIGTAVLWLQSFVLLWFLTRLRTVRQFNIKRETPSEAALIIEPNTTKRDQ